LRRDVAVERSRSCRDKIDQFAGQPCPDAPKFPRLSKSFSLSRFLIFNSAFSLARSAHLFLPSYFSSFLLFSAAHAFPRRARSREDRSTAAAMRLDPTKPQHDQPLGFSWNRNPRSSFERSR